MNFYHRFICNFSSVAVQLTALLKGKPNLLRWTKEADRAFSDLKIKFTIASVLCLPDLEKPFVLKVNASETGVEEILSNEAVCSQTELQCGQQRTSSSEVVWRHWLEGAQSFFTVHTDHKNVMHVMQRQVRWPFFPSRFNSPITY